MRRESLSKEPDRRADRVGLVKLVLPGDSERPEDWLEELAALTDTVGGKVVERVVQKSQRPTAAFFVGKGKAQELADLCRTGELDVLIFDHELAPAQIRNIEKLTGVSVLDRTELILVLFARRAQTKQAQLQVDLARLRYELPRLRHLWSHLERLEGVRGTRGPGETQIETDRRLVRERIAQYERELAVIARRRERESRTRGEMFRVSLVGYTNVGKSTLMNRLTGASTFTEDRLFATLDATTRLMDLSVPHKVLLTDTVGFIRNLPHHLVESFHATLEEVRQADLLLHVADAGHPEVSNQIAAVQGVLADLGCQGKPMLLVFNKCDRVSESSVLDRLLTSHGPGYVVSALTGEGIDRLREAIATCVREGDILLEETVPAADGRALAYVAAHATVLERAYDDTGGQVRVRLTMHPRHAARLRAMLRSR